MGEQGFQRSAFRLPTKEHAFATACSVVGFAAEKLGFSLKKPVFIIGTGRCGTSLLVRILNSHPDIAGYPGEANELWHPKLEPFEFATIDIPPIEIDPRGFSEVSVAAWPSRHEERIRRAFGGFSFLHPRAKVFFTKSAMISFMIPKVLEIFPDAKFVHIYRFGPSVVESYFKKNFGKYTRHKFEEQEYRQHCARYWSDCILEVQGRSKEPPLVEGDSFLEFSYEELCERPRVILDVVAAFLGVSPAEFAFDLSKIVGSKRDVTAYSEDPGYRVTIAAMSPGLELKGYSLLLPPPGG